MAQSHCGARRQVQRDGAGAITSSATFAIDRMLGDVTPFTFFLAAIMPTGPAVS